MSRFIFLLLFVVIAESLPAQNDTIDCSHLKVGNFMYIDEQGISWDIKRTAKNQKETDPKNGKTIKYKIMWLSKCEYKLTQLWTNDKARKKMNYKSLTFRINSSTSTTYTFSCTCSDGKNSNGTVVKLSY